MGTDPSRWDSDGDGWWDGSARVAPAPAQPLPFDGSPVCTGLVAGHQGIHLRVGGNLRGAERPVAIIRGATRSDPSGWILPEGLPVLVQLSSGSREQPHSLSGGLWASVAGPGLRPGPGCAHGPAYTVWAAEPAWQHEVERFAAMLARAAAQAEARWGVTPGRVVVALGGRVSTVEGQVVVLSSLDLQQAIRHGALEDQARLAVALHRVWRSGSPEWSAATAVARALADP